MKMNHLLVYGLGVPSVFVLLSLAVYQTFSAFNTPLSKPLVEMTTGWISFLKKGIPVPSDYNEMGYGRFIGESFLTRPEYHATEIVLGKR